MINQNVDNKGGAQACFTNCIYTGPFIVVEIHDDGLAVFGSETDVMLEIKMFPFVHF